MIVKKVLRPDDSVPSGTYLAEFVKIVGKRLPNGGDGFLATFRIVNGAHAGRLVTALSGPFFEGSEVDRWCSMAGVGVNVGQEIDVERALQGLKVSLRTTLVKRGERHFSNAAVVGPARG